MRLVPAFLTSLPLASILTGTLSAQEPPRAVAVDFVARTHGVAASALTVSSETMTQVPAIGRATFFKISSLKGDTAFGVVVDATGRSWSPDQFRQRVDSAYLNRFSKIDPSLSVRLEDDPRAIIPPESREARIPVAIWLRVDDAAFRRARGADYVGHGVTTGDREPPVDSIEKPDQPLPRAGLDAEDLAQQRELIVAQQAVDALVSRTQAAVAGRLGSKGIRAEPVPEAPILLALLTAEQIREVGKDPEVIWIYPDDLDNTDLNSSATATHRAPAVWSRGYKGLGARVAILEDSRAFDNFWLVIADTRVATDANMDNHATETMGNVGSRHAEYLGMAPLATLYSANATDYTATNLRAAGNWAVSKGADIINNSWGPGAPTGCLSGLGRFFDYKVFANARLVTFAAGNSGTFVNDHAMAFNVLAVGASDDRNTGGWSDDAIAGYSSWSEGTNCSPSNGDREKPDVTATGSRIRSTRIHPPSINTSERQGTSYASPMIAGEAALLIEKNPTLRRKPEALRAIIMASAVNNIEGSSRLSEYDGAGGIDAYSAYLIVNNGWWLQQTIDPRSWAGTNLSFHARSGETIRCVVAWTSHPSSDFTTDPLLTDIDLRLINPSGTTVAGSISWDNSYEVVEYTANATGTWRCRAYRFSTAGTSFEFIGMAVNRMYQLDYDYPW